MHLTHRQESSIVQRAWPDETEMPIVTLLCPIFVYLEEVLSSSGASMLSFSTASIACLNVQPPSAASSVAALLAATLKRGSWLASR